jgi:hypothetical protein
MRPRVDAPLHEQVSDRVGSIRNEYSRFGKR